MKNSKITYFILSLLFAFFVVCGYDLNFSLWLIDENSETFCSTVDVFNYMNFTFNNYFHWFIGDNPCRFNGSIVINHNWILISYYGLLKFYGVYKNSNIISFKVILSELVIYMLMYLGKINFSTDVIWTTGSLLNAMVGFIQLNTIFILFAFLLILGKFIFLKIKDSIWWKRYKKVYIVLLLILSSAMIFPVFFTFILCFFAASFVLSYVYYILPIILNNIVCNKVAKITFRQKSFLIMGGLIFFALDSLLWFYIGINNTDLNYLWKVYVLTVGAHIIYYTLTVAIISPKKFQITLSKIWKTTSKYKFLK